MALTNKSELPSDIIKTEKRVNQKPIPDAPSRYISKLQFTSINKLQNFGWELYFICRSNLEEVITVMRFPSTQENAVIEKDDTANKAHELIIRSG